MGLGLHPVNVILYKPFIAKGQAGSGQSAEAPPPSTMAVKSLLAEQNGRLFLAINDVYE